MENKIQKNTQNSTLNENTPTALVVEDDVSLNRLICKILDREGIKTRHAMNGADAISAARKIRDAIILLDFRLPDMNGTQVITALREEKIETPIIVMTGNGDERTAVEIMKLGVRDYVIKELDFITRLPRIIHQTFDAIAKEKELARALVGLESNFALLSAIINSSGDIIIFSLDKEYRYTAFNGKHREEMKKVWNIDIKIGDRMLDVMSIPEQRFKAQASMDRALLGETFSEIQKQPNLDIYYEFSWNPVYLKNEIVGVTGFIRDISESKQAEKKQKQLEEQLRQSQKLEAIGQLSSGVAHDFNNLLGGIMGHAELLKMSLNPGSRLLEHSDVIISLCQKAADLTRQLLTFARKAPFELQKIDMNAFIKQVVGLMERTIDRKIEIAVSLQEQPAFISGDRNQLENALLNIAINARDAMPEGGSLCITSETVDLNNAMFPEEHGTVMEGPYIKVSIADTGTGMSKEIKDRIFEPFFTTKETGKGTGLGLASVYGCVKQHNGYITADSLVGKGTRFDLFFPIATSGPIIKQLPEDKLLPGNGSLLVIDDDPVFHDVLNKIFTPIGYTVHCCASGAEAVEYFRLNNSTIDVVVLDMNMPKMSGKQCFKHLKEINANVKVIVATGYGENSERAALKKEGVRMFVQKPYKAAELANKIKELMGNAPATNLNPLFEHPSP